jgi:diadenosine tetraphosphate (Ap4A) HIT family hydrolase
MVERAWPADWDDLMVGKDCPLCGALGKGDNDFTVEVFVGQVAEVRLERRSLLPGYCTVVWRLGHVAEPTALDATQASLYWAEVMAAGRAVQARFNPLKMNYSTLGNAIPHLHTHVLPRYSDDPAPGGPIAWEDLPTAGPLPEATLRRQAADLRAFLIGSSGSASRKPPDAARPTFAPDDRCKYGGIYHALRAWRFDNLSLVSSLSLWHSPCWMP